MTQQYNTTTSSTTAVGYPVRAGLHWPSIIGGTFLALALFVISGILARASGVDWTWGAGSTSGRETGAIIWGLIAAIICFGLGGWLSAWMAREYRGNPNGLMNGLMVWAVGVPVLVLVLNAGRGPMLGSSGMGASDAITASARLEGGGIPSMSDAGRSGRSMDYTTRGHAADWWLLVSLGLGLVAAAGMGLVGGGHEEDYGVSTTEPRRPAL